MSQQQALARRLFEEGGTLVLLGMPPGTEFGIDVNFWNVGEKFRGVKMIPPGLHFIYFSAVSPQGDTAPRTGFYHVFGAREVVVRHYNTYTEDLVVEEPSVEEVGRIRSNLREMDRFLGAYPLESWEKWISLTLHVDEAELGRMVPLSGRVCSAAELIPVAGFRSSRTQRNTALTPPTTATDTQNTPTDTSTHTPQTTDELTLSSDGKIEIEHTHTNTQTHIDSNTLTDTLMDTATHTGTPDTHTDTHTHTSPKNVHTTHTDAKTVIPQTHTDTNTLTNTLMDTDTHTDTQTHTNTNNPNTPTPHTPPDTIPPTDLPQPPPDPRVPPQLPEMVQKEGTMFRFTHPPEKGYREGATPSEVTKYSLDSSYRVRKMLEQVKGPGSLVAELQLSFVSFLVGRVWDAWEHWRELLATLCRAEETLLQHPHMYTKVISVLYYQVMEIPEDLFVDIVESNNFLASSLTTLFANIHDNASALPPPLVLKARRFKDHLSAKFQWDLSLGDEGEDAPVVVET